MESVFDIAADLDTPVSAFLKLEPFKTRFLLESVEGGERLGRYSFIGFGDALELRLSGDRLAIDGETHLAPREPRKLLRSFRDALRAAPKLQPTITGVPFTGGLVGVTGYEIAHRLETITTRHASDGVPDAAYCAPQSLLVFDHLTRRAALLHDGPDHERASLRRDVIAALRAGLPQRRRPRKHGPPVQSISRREFLTSVRYAQDQIAEGEAYQLVLSIRFSGPCETPPFEAYRALRLLNPSPYMYFCRFDDFAIVGSSPEVLVRLEGRRAILRPIAGTRPRGVTDEEDLRLERELLTDPKENAEHVMLVDLARNDLGKVAVPGSIAVDPFRTIERYSHVMHMVSGTTGLLAHEADAFDLFAAAFPAGTVVGAPKIRAMELIDAIEPVSRGAYAGTVGYFGTSGAMDQAIAIRTLVFRGGEYVYQAGAGIVADSVPEREHEEILAKSAALEGALCLAEEGL